SKTRESVSPSWLPGGKHECSGFSHRREANGEASLLGNCDTPRKLADLDRLDDLKICDVDDGDVVRDAIGGEKIFFVRGKRHVPDALGHEKIFLDLVRRTVDHGNAVGRTECHEASLAVPGDADPDRLNGLLPQPWYIERDLLFHLVFHRVDDAYRSTDFGRNPDLGGVALTDLDRVHDDEFVGIDYADGIALLVRDIGGEGARLGADEDEDAHAEQPIARAREVAMPLPQRTSDARLRGHPLFEPRLAFWTVDP